MTPLFQAVAATVSISLLSLAGIAFVAVGRKARSTVLFVMVAFAAGAMMAASFFHLLPEATEGMGSFRTGMVALVGFSCFFILERFLHWRHCHKGGDCEVHPYTTLSVVGDALHNFLDGVVIGSAFLADTTLGISATVVIAAHELPQELGDYAILVHGGHSHRKALGLNFASAITSVAGAVLAWFGLAGHHDQIPYVMAFAAGNFIYVSSSDLVPELHKEQDLRRAALAFAFFVAAVVLMGLFAGSGDGHVH
jgi:zinc and cadmium transporter